MSSRRALYSCLWLLLWPAALALAQRHPLDPLSASEIRQSFELLRAHFAGSSELPHDALCFPVLALREPPKAERTREGARRAEAQVLHWPTNRLWLAELDLGTGRVAALTLAPSGTQAALCAEEYEAAAQLVRAHEPWRKAVRARGADPDRAHIDVWAPGHVTESAALTATLSHGALTRLTRALSFEGGRAAAPGAHAPPQNPYDRPLDGLLVLVDMNARRVAQLTDTMPEQPVSRESGNAEETAPVLKPLLTRQPAGSDLRIQGQLVQWGLWQFRVALHPREGLVLYDVKAHARGELRKVAARMSLSEIYVPYGFADAEWAWRSAFDVGEYNPGGLAHSLEKRRDVPDHARFLDATLASSRGVTGALRDGAVTLKRAIALYERDAGVLWSRTDPLSAARDTRPARELVVTWSTWIGNYIYGFDWIFKQDGSLEVQVALTGTTLNRSFSARPERSAPKVGKDARGVLMAAPNHQHFFSFRLDLDVDGERNHVMESELRSIPEGAFGNGFEKLKVALEREGPRDAAPAAERKWCVMSNGEKNVIGEAPAFTLEPRDSVRPYSRDEFPGLKRAQFAKHALWVTRFREEERFAAGAFPSQAERAEGVNRYVEAPELLTPEHGEDVVLWYTLGLSHVPRLEDYPVMNVERVGFRLAPHGFFDRNPALDAGLPAR